MLPLNGSREGLFFALFPLVPESKNGGQARRADPQSVLLGLSGGGDRGGG